MKSERKIQLILTYYTPIKICCNFNLQSKGNNANFLSEIFMVFKFNDCFVLRKVTWMYIPVNDLRELQAPCQ